MAEIRRGDWIMAETEDTLVQGTVEVVTGDFIRLVDSAGTSYRVHLDEVKKHTPSDRR